MELAIEELQRSMKYHQRQLEENLQNIRGKEEAIELLKVANEKEIFIMDQINKAIELIKMDMDLSQSISVKKQPTNSIEEGLQNDNIPLER